MAEMLASALVQEAVSRSVSIVLGKRKEKSTSQEHIMERLEMAVNELELVLERSAKLPIIDVSLLRRRNMMLRAYTEATDLLDKHKLHEVPAGQEHITAQGVKRKRWVICANNMSGSDLVGLSTDDVRRFEWYADCAGKFLRDVESGCSLHHSTFCNPIVRHLLEGKTLIYHSERGNILRRFYIWPMFSTERGVEAMLRYHYEDSTMAEKCFNLLFTLRLSESTDIVGGAIKGLQLLASQFRLAAECAIGELTLLPNLQDIVQSYAPPWVGIQERHIKDTKNFRQDPACCKGNRHGLFTNNVSTELADIFPEQVILWGFQCYVLAVEHNTCSSFDEVGRSNSRGWRPPLVLTAVLLPHHATETHDSCAAKIIGDSREYRDASSIHQVAETLRSGATNCFSCQPDMTNYEIYWITKHGAAWFEVEKTNTEERADAPKLKSGLEGGTKPEELHGAVEWGSSLC